jgi:hypothetical protein
VAPLADIRFPYLGKGAVTPCCTVRQQHPQARSPRKPIVMSSLSPFIPGPQPAPRSFWAKLFLLSRPEEAFRALTNRFAAAPVDSVGPADLSQDLSAFGVRGPKAREVLVRVWRETLQKLAADDRIVDEEAEYLASLRRALGLTSKEVRSAEEAVLDTRIAEEVQGAIADDRLTLAERAKIEDLTRALRLTDEITARILNRARLARLEVAAKAAVADERLSPTEMADLAALARALGTSLSFDAATQQTLDRYALLWHIENGQLPAVTVPIVLQRGEICHAVADAVWMEMRTRTERVNYGGPVMSVRICKGVRYRVGSVRVQRITRDELTPIDQGRLYVTNKRIIFDGAKKNTAIRYSSLIAFEPFGDGVVLEKATGKSPHIRLANTDIEVFHSILGAALSQG